MGSRNVGMVFEHWTSLNDKAKLALIWMSAQAHDEAQPPVFWGDRDELARAIGATSANPEAAARAVRRALKDLRECGAIAWSGQAHTGVRSSYALCLDPAFTWVPVGTGRDVSWARCPRTMPAAERRTVSDHQSDREADGERPPVDGISPQEVVTEWSRGGHSVTGEEVTQWSERRSLSDLPTTKTSITTSMTSNSRSRRAVSPLPQPPSEVGPPKGGRESDDSVEDLAWVFPKGSRGSSPELARMAYRAAIAAVTATHPQLEGSAAHEVILGAAREYVATTPHGQVMDLTVWLESQEFAEGKAHE